MRKIFNTTILFLIVLHISCNAQSFVVPSYSEVETDSLSIIHAVGDVIANNNENIYNGSLLLSYTIEATKGESLLNISLLSLYPNPVKDILILTIKETSIVNMEYKLYNYNGMIIISDHIKSEQTNIDLSGLPSGVYNICICDNGHIIKSYKIVKKI